MIRYHLDDLGWYQFELLIQSLLKGRLGLGIESWGGRGDWGIDAYHKGVINYPSKSVALEGIFIFQVKFVEHANAAGASSDTNLVRAVKAEIARIKGAYHSWKRKVNHYILVTNASVTAQMKSNISSMFNEVFPITEIHSHGGADVCDWLDNNPNIRKAFPQLLSIRDLELVLSDVVNKDVITISRAVIEEAKDLSKIFVPTESYRKTWETLKAHKFVVLDGPPEVGKTAIAYMIALTLVLDEWEAIYCAEPKDFLKLYKPQSKQLFIADDAFGRTEYDPSRGKLWEKDLPHIMRYLSASHQMIFTSRKHILERAYKDMDLQDISTKFPKLAEVIVDATHLTISEKALMLYRHAKAENLIETAKKIVRDHAKGIVANPNFTPERVRRFVKERLAELSSQFWGGSIDANVLKNEVLVAINNPTERMRKTYDKLSESNKWLLASLVAIDRGKAVAMDDLKDVYANYCPMSGGWQPFDELMDEMTEAFLKKKSRETWGIDKNKGGMQKIMQWEVEWIHPSYRDLVIDKISEDASFSKKLLQDASTEIIKLAISVAGGKEGERQLPLLTSSDQWAIFERRCLSLVAEITDDKIITSILASLHSAWLHSTNIIAKENLAQVSGVLLESLRNRWNVEKTILLPTILDSYYKLSEIISDYLIPSPNLKDSWNAAEKSFAEILDSWKQGSVTDSHEFDEWIELVDVVNNYEPRFLRTVGFPEKYSLMIKDFFESIAVIAGKKFEDAVYESWGVSKGQVKEWADDPSDYEDGADVYEVSGVASVMSH